MLTVILVVIGLVVVAIERSSVSHSATIITSIRPSVGLKRAIDVDDFSLAVRSAELNAKSGAASLSRPEEIVVNSISQFDSACNSVLSTVETNLGSPAVAAVSILVVSTVWGLLLAGWSAFSKVFPNGSQKLINNFRLITRKLGSISATSVEVVASGLYFFIGAIVAFMVSLTEDDTVDAMAIANAVFIVGGLGLVLLALNSLVLYLTSSNAGEASKIKMVMTDLINFGLGVFRIATCLVRYMFYDLQVDNVDLILHKTYELNFTSAATNDLSTALLILEVTLDIAFTVINLLLSFGKIAIVLYLL